jgi:hypothetical protein
MTTLRTIPKPSATAPIATPTADRLATVFLNAAEHRVYPLTVPAAQDIEAARNELVRAAEARPTPAEVRSLIGRLVLSYPQQAQPQEPAVYIGALEAEASAYPPDVLAAACRDVLRSCRFLPTVAELVAACEARVATRQAMLRGIELVDRQRKAEEERRLDNERRLAERIAYQQQIERTLGHVYGDRLPDWLTIERAWAGASKVGGISLAERKACDGDGAAFVQLRRACLFGLACEREQPPFPRPTDWPKWSRADVADLAEHLARGDDAAAAAMVEPGYRLQSRPEGASLPGWPIIRATMARALAPESVRRAAIAEGLQVQQMTGATREEIAF